MFWQLVFDHPVASFFLILAIGWSISGIISAFRCDCDEDNHNFISIRSHTKPASDEPRRHITP